MAELRIAVIGSGYMGRSYAECITRYNSRAKLVAVHGGQRGPGLAADYGVGYEPTYEAVLTRPDVDAVLLATPHSTHRDQTILAAQHGKHVLVEKPMAVTVMDCDTMIAACRKAGVYLEVIQTLRFRGTLARAKRLIAEDKIGQVRMIYGQALRSEYLDQNDNTWASRPEEGGGFLDMGVHNFDIMRFLTGSEVELVFCHEATYGETRYTELNAMTELVFANGVMAQMWMAHEIPQPGLPNTNHRYYVVGDKGVLDIDGYGKLQLGAENRWELVWEQPPIDYVNKPLERVRLEAFFTQTQAFVDDVLDGRKPTVPGEEGRAAVEVVEAAKKSAQSRQTVRLHAHQ